MKVNLGSGRDRHESHTSRTFRAARKVGQVLATALPRESPQRRLAARVARKVAVLSTDVSRAFSAAGARGALGSAVTEQAAADLRRQRKLASSQPDPLRFRIIILPGAPGLLNRTLASLEAQTWDHWKVVTGPLDVATVNSTIASGSASTGLVLLLAEGDTLAPDCLYELAAAAHRDPLLEVITWDDDVLAVDGSFHDPRIRPSWSPDILFSANYVGHAAAVRHSLIMVTGGLAADLPMDPDLLMWDLLLRATVDIQGAGRVARVLSHVVSRSEAADETARQIVQRAVAARGWRAEAVLAHDAVRVRWIDAAPSATLVIPTRHNRRLLTTLFEGLRRTDHPDMQVIVVDNGERTPENEAWYETQRADGLDLGVEWWSKPFNYSAVNNAGRRRARGDILVFLNDDIEVLDPDWLRQLCGWAAVPGVGTVGMELVDGNGLIQHGGVIVGLNGFADHLFQGLRPGSETLLGRTTWYRNVLAVTGACLAVRRELMDELGGFDEHLSLCGSDVAVGLEAHLRGLRNLCLPDNSLRHLESATRGGDAIPDADFHLSYWKYRAWLHGGDPYWSPRLSNVSLEPRLRRPEDPGSLDIVSQVLNRRFEVWNAGDDLTFASQMAQRCRASKADVDAVHDLHRRNRAPVEVRSVNWVIPGMESPFYGGINTALRIANHLTVEHGVENRFLASGGGPEPFIRAAITAAFPALEGSPIDLLGANGIDDAPPADAAVATLWSTAFELLRAPIAHRKFYLVQDYEPMFYPAGTMYALAEESYRLGFHGICNTANLGAIYRNYGGTAMSFIPAVDPSVFHADGRVQRGPDAPVTLFVYARPNHFRNCWELALPALVEVKDRLGDRVRIVAAGSWAIPEPPDRLPAIDYRGMLEYRSTGTLYRSCDVGLALTVSEHPSYLPLELMACGAAVVAFDNPAGHWLLRDGENCVLSARTVDALADSIERVAVNPQLRHRLAATALQDIAEHHTSWDRALEGIYEYLCDPEGCAASSEPAPGHGTHRLDRDRFAVKP